LELVKPPHKLASGTSADWLSVIADLARKNSAKSKTSVNKGSGKS
jgi:hypothetical protein